LAADGFEHLEFGPCFRSTIHLLTSTREYLLFLLRVPALLPPSSLFFQQFAGSLSLNVPPPLRGLLILLLWRGPVDPPRWPVVVAPRVLVSSVHSAQDVTVRLAKSPRTFINPSARLPFFARPSRDQENAFTHLLPTEAAFLLS